MADRVRRATVEAPLGAGHRGRAHTHRRGV